MVKTFTLLFGFLVIISKLTFGQVISDFPCPDYPTVRDVYVPGTDNYHEYIHKSVICDLKEYPNCTIDFAFQVMISSKQFVAPYTDDVPVVNCGVTSIPVIGPIVTVINNKQKTVQNYTLPEHVFYEGKILRYFEINDNKLLVVTFGQGNNKSEIRAWLNKNSLSQAIIWNPIDAKLSKKIIDLLKKPKADVSTEKVVLKESTLKYFQWLMDVWDKPTRQTFNLLSTNTEIDWVEIEKYLKWLKENSPYLGVGFEKNMREYFTEVDAKWKKVPQSQKVNLGEESAYDKIFYDWETITKLDGGGSTYRYTKFTKVFEPNTIFNITFYPNDEALVSIPSKQKNIKSLDLLWKKENGEWKIVLTEFLMPRWKNPEYQKKLKVFYNQSRY